MQTQAVAPQAGHWGGAGSEPVSCVLPLFLPAEFTLFYIPTGVITHLFESVDDLNEFFCVFSYCLLFHQKIPHPKSPQTGGQPVGYYTFLLVYAQDHHLTEEYGAVRRMKFSFCSILYDLNFYPMSVVT